MADPNWKDQALDELAGPHHQLIPLLAKIAYDREQGAAPVESKLGLVGKLIEGLESGAGWKPGDPTGDQWKHLPIYEHLLNKEGELNLQQYKGMPDPISSATMKRNELMNFDDMARLALQKKAQPPPKLPQVGSSWNPWQSHTSLKEYRDNQGNVLGFTTEYQREMMRRMREQGKQYSPLLYPVSTGPLQRPPAPR